PRGLRAALPPRPVRRHAAARGAPADATVRPRDHPAGRAVRRARRPDAAAAPGVAAHPVAGLPQDHPAGHARHRRGDLHVGRGLRHVGASGPHPRASQGSAAAPSRRADGDYTGVHRAEAAGAGHADRGSAARRGAGAGELKPAASTARAFVGAHIRRTRMSEQAQIRSRPAAVASPSAGRAARRSRQAGAALERAPIAGWQVAAGRVAVVVGLIALWEMLTRIGVLDPFFWSTPGAIATTWWKTIQAGNAFGDTWYTFRSTLLGFAIGTGLGAAIGLAFWWSRYWARMVEPLLIAFHAMPKLALAPIVVLVFGLELPSKVAMAVALTIVVTAITAYAGVRSVDPDLEKLLFSLGASRWQVFTKVVVPWTMPWVISALRLNIGL